MRRCIGAKSPRRSTWIHENIKKATAFVEPWELVDALTRSMVSMTTLEHMERTVLGYATRYPSTPPATLLPAVSGQIRRLCEVLGNPQRLRVRQRAVVSSGVLCGLAGNLWLDLGEDDRAAGFFDAGELAGLDGSWQ